jgi:hypothetical protein
LPKARAAQEEQEPEQAVPGPAQEQEVPGQEQLGRAEQVAARLARPEQAQAPQQGARKIRTLARECRLPNIRKKSKRKPRILAGLFYALFLENVTTLEVAGSHFGGNFICPSP